jgi:hypothetical protein
MQIPGISSTSISSTSDIYAAATSSLLSTSSFGIPLTDSISAIGFTIGFTKGYKEAKAIAKEEIICVSSQEN